MCIKFQWHIGDIQKAYPGPKSIDLWWCWLASTWVLVTGYLVWMSISPLHGCTDLLGLSFLRRGKQEATRFLSNFGKMYPYTALLKAADGPQPANTQKKGLNWAYCFLCEWKATGSQDLLYVQQYAGPWHDSSLQWNGSLGYLLSFCLYSQRRVNN